MKYFSIAFLLLFFALGCTDKSTNPDDNQNQTPKDLNGTWYITFDAGQFDTVLIKIEKPDKLWYGVNLAHGKFDTTNYKKFDGKYYPQNGYVIHLHLTMTSDDNLKGYLWTQGTDFGFKGVRKN